MILEIDINKYGFVDKFIINGKKDTPFHFSINLFNSLLEELEITEREFYIASNIFIMALRCRNFKAKISL